MRLRFFLPAVSFLLLLLVAAFAGGCDCDDDDDDDNNDDSSPTPSDDDSGDDDDDASPTPPADDDDDDDDDDDTGGVPAACEEGKELLRAGAGPLAAVEFREGLTTDERAFVCRYGLLLADTLHQLDTLSVIVAYIEMFLEGYQPPETGKDDWPQTGQDFLEEIVGLMLGGLILEASDEAIEQAEWLRENAVDGIYPIDRLPMILNFKEVADAFGDWDFADAVAAESWAGLLPGLLEHLTSLNLDFDLGLIFQLMDEDFDLPTDELIGLIVDYLLQLFDNPLHPDFFTLKDNAVPFREAGLKVGLGLRHATETYELIIAEEMDQTNDVLGYDDLNGNLQFDENETLKIPHWDVLTEEEDTVAWAFYGVFADLAASFLDYTEYDLDPETAQPFRPSSLNQLLVAFGLPALIPDWDFLAIDFGAMYRDADPTAFRDRLVIILKLVDAFLP